MGTFAVPIQVGDLASQRLIDVEALVDTGATYTVLPQDVLNDLGIELEDRRSFQLADERTVEYPIGYARLRVNGNATVVLVVSAPQGTSPLLGATALENLSLGVDPVQQRLVPVNALLKRLT